MSLATSNIFAALDTKKKKKSGKSSSDRTEKKKKVSKTERCPNSEPFSSLKSYLMDMLFWLAIAIASRTQKYVEKAPSAGVVAR